MVKRAIKNSLYILPALTLMFVPDTAFAFADDLVGIVQWIVLALLNLFALFAGLAASLLNFALNTFVAGFGDLIVNEGFGGAINDTWEIIRGVVNLTFVFGLIYIGILTILDTGVQTKRALVTLIIAALLVNFSLFISKAIVDVSNIMATSIYETATKNINKSNEFGLAGVVFARVGLHSYVNGGTDAKQQRELLNQVLSELKIGKEADSMSKLFFIIIYGFLGMLFFMKAIAAFGIGAFVLIVRFVMLIFLMILSPIAFAATVLPGVSSLTKTWWTTFLNQAFVAPVYVFMLYILLLILETGGLTSSGKQQDLTATLINVSNTNQWNDAIGMVAYFVLAIVGLIGIAVVAKSMSTKGTTITMQAAGWARGAAIGAVATGGFAGRHSAGRAFHALSRNERFKDWAANSQVGKALHRGTQRVAKSSFDVRATPGLNKAIKSSFGGDLGKAPKKSFDKHVKDQTKRDTEYMESLGERPETEQQRQEQRLKDEEVKKARASVKTAERAADAAAKAGNTTLRDTQLRVAEHNRNTLASREAELTRLKKPRQSRYVDQVENKFKGIRSITNPFGLFGRNTVQKQITKEMRRQLAKDKSEKGQDKLLAAVQANKPKDE